MADKLFGALFIGVGTALFFYTLFQIWRAYRSLAWPVLEAEVVNSSVKERRGRRISYEPVVRYRYEQKNMVYEGRTLVFSATSLTGSREEAEEFVKQLPVGIRIPVRVCPTKTNLSVIRPGFERAWWIPLVFSLMFVFGGFSLWNNH